MHSNAYEFVAAVVERYQPSAPVYEIGARNLNGTIRALFPSEGYLGVDIREGVDVDLVADAATYSPPDLKATVVCCEVLEHTPDAEAIVTRAARALVVGGLLILTCAGHGRLPHSAIDAGLVLHPGEFYKNLSLEELTNWASDAGVEPLASPSPVVEGDVYYVGQKVRHA